MSPTSWDTSTGRSHRDNVDVGKNSECVHHRGELTGLIRSFEEADASLREVRLHSTDARDSAD